MNRKKLFIFIRYLSLSILLVSCLSNSENTLYPVITMIILLSLIHISEPTRLGMISYAVFCLKKKKKYNHQMTLRRQLK
ncbi:hypothetical protein CDFC105_61386 [Clostridioides difficile]|nr:hypothetical protein CDFC105_61386 [Clostridioides difficile]